MRFPKSVFPTAVFATLIWISPGFAADTSAPSSAQPLSLQTLVTEVVEWNAELINQRLNVEIGDSLAEGESFHYEPDFFGSLKYHDTNTPNNAAETISRAGLETNFEEKWNFVAGLSGDLPLGTQWSVEYRQSETSSSVIDVLRGYTYEYESQVKATLRQPLLKGFGRDANLADFHSARLESEVIKSAYREKLFDVITFTIREYWKLYGAQILAESLADSVARLEESAQLTQQRYESGDISESDLIEIKSSLLARKIELRSMLNSMESVQNQIRRLLNNSSLASSTQSLRAQNEESSSPITLGTLDGHLDYAKENRALFEAARLKEEQAFVAYQKQRNQARPQLDVVASGWVANLDDEWLMSDAFYGQFPSWQVGFEFKVPLLGDRKAKSKLTQARLQLRQAENAVKDLEREMRLRLSDAMDQRDAAITQLADMQTTYQLKQQLVEGEFQRFKAGELGITELIEKEDDATGYYRRVVNKLIETKVNQANLDRETGLILARYYPGDLPF